MFIREEEGFQQESQWQSLALHGLPPTRSTHLWVMDEVVFVGWSAPGPEGGGAHRAAGLSKGSWRSFCLLGRSSFILFFLGSSLSGSCLMLFQILTLQQDKSYGKPIQITLFKVKLNQSLSLIMILVSPEGQTGGVHTNTQHLFCSWQGLVCRQCEHRTLMTLLVDCTSF